MCACICGCNKLENRELGLCATCNKARMVGERPVAVKERKPLAAISARRTETLKLRADAYRVVKQTSSWCGACGSLWQLTPSHVLSQGQFKKHISNPRNLITLCRACHSCWENNKPAFRSQFPTTWALKMKIMKELEPQYYEQFKAKHNDGH